MAAPSAAPSPSGDPTTGTLRSGTLVVEPSGGFSGVYNLINGAKHSIDVTMYEFSDTTAESDLAAAAARGVQVRVILDQREKSTNDAAYRYFTDHKVGVVWSSASYEYTHQKTMVVDDSEAVIMTANLTSKYYATSRDFLVTDSGPADISAIVAVFDADYAHRSVTPGDGSDLVWSPGSQDQLLAVINSATKSLRIYSEEMGDTTVEDALIAAAKRGVTVQVCGENADGEYDSDFSRLSRAGVQVSYFSSSAALHPREGHRGRLRHRTRPRVHRLGELLQHLAKPQPRTRADHLQPGDPVRDRLHVHDRLPERKASFVTRHRGWSLVRQAPSAPEIPRLPQVFS